MSDRSRRPLLLLILAALTSACGDGLEDRVLAIESTNSLAGILFVDLNGDSVFSEADRRLPAQIVTVGYAGASAATAVDTTDLLGAFEMPRVPVGRIEIRLSPALFGDSLRVIDETIARFTMKASTPVNRPLGLSFPAYSINEAKTLASGSALFIAGTVLASRTPEANGTVFLRGTDGAIRLTGVPATFGVAPGDSIRVRGYAGTSLGYPVVEPAAYFTLALSPTSITAIPVTSSEAAGARNGVLDADLVEVLNAAVVDTATVAGTLVATVNDGTGVVQVHLRAGFGFPFASIQPGVSTLSLARGTLIPTNPTQGGSPRWALLPRNLSDLLVATPAPALAD